MKTARRASRIIALACSVLAADLGLPPILRAESAPVFDTGDPPGLRRDVLAPQQWKDLDKSVDRALAWLAGEQRADGSFPTMGQAQPSVTALCVLAYLSCDHLPGRGRYGAVIDRGIDYVLRCQQPQGLITLLDPATKKNIEPAQCAAYNHAIGGLLLSEAYGMTTGEANRRIRSAVESAIVYTLKKHPNPKRRSADRGGW